MRLGAPDSHGVEVSVLASVLSKSRVFTANNRLEEAVFARRDSIHSSDDSPERFEIMTEEFKRGKVGPSPRMFPIMIPAFLGMYKSLWGVKDNPAVPKTRADPTFLKEIEAYALGLGASSVGYTKVPARWVFRNKAIAFDNAIVLTMEMDRDGFDTAPSMACETTVMEVYRDLGRVSIKVAEFLRQHGYGAHAGHPLMGVALYPPLAQMAGLGWIGLNGIIITPEHGPRVRLAAVYTSIENLPFSESNPHAWVADFCATCKVCIKKCPAGALYGTPVDHGNGQITYVDNGLCFPYFSDNYGCAKCITVCPFNRVPYETIKSKQA
jgi:epoxyqueuosine reductase